MGQYQKYRSTQSTHATAVSQKGSTRARIIGGIIALAVLAAASLGIFVFVQQQNKNATSSNNTHGLTAQPTSSGLPFSVSFTGTVSGQLAISTVNLCGTAQEASTYAVDANGSVSGTVYDFTILILNYHGPGTYSTAGNGATAAVSLVNTNNSTQTWVSQGNAGSAVVSGDGQSGTITALISSPTSGKQQVQVTGTWSCG